MLSAVKISLIGNIILFSMKAATLLLVNSLAIATDLGISLVALLVSIFLLYSVKMSSRPADTIHNYGYGKIEHVCEAMEGIVLIGIAVAISFQAVTTFLHPRHVVSPTIGFGASAIGATINVIGGIYIMSMARKSASPAIRAEGFHYFLEAFISGTIAVSFVLIVILRANGFEHIATQVDPITALLVSIVIAIPSFNLAREAFFKLLDSSIDESGKMDVLKHLSKHIEKYCEFEDLRTRIAGRKKFIEFKIILPSHLSFEDGHRIVTVLEYDISHAIPNSEVRIKMEPCKRDCTYTKRTGECPYIPSQKGR